MVNAYTIMMAFVLIASLFFNKEEQNSRKQFVIITCIAMFVLLGLRNAYVIGNDAESYYAHFRHLGTWGDVFSSINLLENPAFTVWMKIVHSITNGNYQWFVTINSAFVLGVLGRFIYRHSPNVTLSVACYWGLLIFVEMFIIQKQAIAMSFILLSYDALLERRAGRFVAYVIAASLFHFPAIIFLPFYIIDKVIRADKFYLLFLGALLVVVFLFRTQLVQLMIYFYSTDIGDTGRDFFATKVIIMILIVVGGLIIKPPRGESAEYQTLLKILGIAISLQTFSTFNNTFERLANYYFQFAVVFIPAVFTPNSSEYSQEGSVAVLSKSKDISFQYLVGQIGTVFVYCFSVWRFADYIINVAPKLYLPFRFFFQ